MEEVLEVVTLTYPYLALWRMLPERWRSRRNPPIPSSLGGFPHQDAAGGAAVGMDPGDLEAVFVSPAIFCLQHDAATSQDALVAIKLTAIVDQDLEVQELRDQKTAA